MNKLTSEPILRGPKHAEFDKELNLFIWTPLQITPPSGFTENQ